MTGRLLIAVVGPTATGKSAIAVELASRFGGAIVNADSRQVYRGMDIGTAKPSVDERGGVPHHLYDIADPADGFSLGVYLERARETLDELWTGGTLPWVVGGTGQYVWALLEAWTVPEVPPDAALRAALAEKAETEGGAALHAELRSIDPVAADRIDPANVRRVVRAIEVYRLTGRPISEWQTKGDPGFDYFVLGVDQPDEVLHARIAARVRMMFAAGFVDEARELLARGLDVGAPAMSAIGYQEAARVTAGTMDEAEAIEATVAVTRRLVRRQRQWFRKGDERIAWGSTADELAPGVERFLSSDS